MDFRWDFIDCLVVSMDFMVILQVIEKIIRIYIYIYIICITFCNQTWRLKIPEVYGGL